MGGGRYGYYMRMLNLEWKSSQETGLQGNASCCDGICRVWN